MSSRSAVWSESGPAGCFRPPKSNAVQVLLFFFFFILAWPVALPHEWVDLSGHKIHSFYINERRGATNSFTILIEACTVRILKLKGRPFCRHCKKTKLEDGKSINNYRDNSIIWLPVCCLTDFLWLGFFSLWRPQWIYISSYACELIGGVYVPKSSGRGDGRFLLRLPPFLPLPLCLLQVFFPQFCFQPLLVSSNSTLCYVL